MRNRIVFNDLQLPKFLDVISIKNPVLPSFEIKNNKTIWKERIIDVEIAFNKRGLIKIHEELELIRWVRGNNFLPSKLFLPNDTSNYYLARLANNIDITGLRRGKMTISFICENPFKHRHNETKIQNTINTFEIDYNGTESVYPTLEINVTSECEEIYINFSNKEYDNFIKLVGNFNQGDKVIVSQYNNHITINGHLRMGIWSLDSKRHKLIEGNNYYVIQKGNVNVNIIYTELNL